MLRPDEIELSETRWPPPGYIFTTCSGSLMSDIVAVGQRLKGWVAPRIDDDASHVGVFGAWPFVWEADWRSGVVRRPIGCRKGLRIWRPPREAELKPADFARAFAELERRRGRRYDWLWIATFGSRQRDGADICTELAKRFMDELTARVGGWAGRDMRRLAPNHFPRLLEETTTGRGAL